MKTQKRVFWLIELYAGRTDGRGSDVWCESFKVSRFISH